MFNETWMWVMMVAVAMDAILGTYQENGTAKNKIQMSHAICMIGNLVFIILACIFCGCWWWPLVGAVIGFTVGSMIAGFLHNSSLYFMLIAIGCYLAPAITIAAFVLLFL